jgi:beta-phosphoglucomutase-like phosphatase (HAD superfamily)
MKLLSDTKMIIWDLDGTIIDSFSIAEDIIPKLFASKGLPIPSRELMLANFHGKIEDLFHELVDLPNEEFTALIKEFFVIDNEYIKEVSDHMFPDVVKFSQAAHQRGVTQIVVTNRPHGVRRGNGSPRNIIANSPLAECITDFVCGDESQYRKPMPEVLDNISYDPNTTLVIGDQFVDAQFAHNLGAQGILVNRQGEVPHLEKLADGWESHITIVPSLDEVQL